MEIVLPNTPRNGLSPCLNRSQKYITADRILLNPLAKNFKPNLNPLAPIFIPSAEVLDRDSQGIHKFQQHRNVSESEDVLDITPTAFDSETLNLSMSSEVMRTHEESSTSPLTFLEQTPLVHGISTPKERQGTNPSSSNFISILNNLSDI